MTAGEPFFDSSVLLYLLSDVEQRAERVEDLLLHDGHVSIQVLNEVASVAIRKQALSMREVRELLEVVRGSCHTHSLTVETHELGLDISERYGFSIYDSMIVASALEHGCRTLLTEDLQHGQVIDKRLRIVNPFA